MMSDPLTMRAEEAVLAAIFVSGGAVIRPQTPRAKRSDDVPVMRHFLFFRENLHVAKLFGLSITIKVMVRRQANGFFGRI